MGRRIVRNKTRYSVRLPLDFRHGILLVVRLGDGDPVRHGVWVVFLAINTRKLGQGDDLNLELRNKGDNGDAMRAGRDGRAIRTGHSFSMVKAE